MILITGAGGLLGSQIKNKLTDQKEDFVQVLRSENFTFEGDTIYMDVTKKKHFIELEKQPTRPHTILHLAGKIDISFKDNLKDGKPTPADEDVYELYTTNTVSCANILEYSRNKNVKHIIYASSQTVYGMPKENEIFTEESQIKPLEHYAQSKYFGEEILKMGVSDGINVTVLRFPGLYSEERKSGLVYNFCRSALENAEINITLKIPIPFDTIHVCDAADATIKAIKYQGNGFQCFNIATGKPNSIILLAGDISKKINGSKINNDSPDQPKVIMNSKKALDTLKWKPISFDKRLSAFLGRIKND